MSVTVIRLVFQTPQGPRTKLGTFSNAVAGHPRHQKEIAHRLYRQSLSGEKADCMGYVVELPSEHLTEVPLARILPLWKDWNAK